MAEEKDNKEKEKKKAAKPAAPAGGKKGKREGGAAGTVVAGRPKGLGHKPRYQAHWEEKVRAVLVEKFKYASVMQAPRFVKIVLNMGVGDAIGDPRLLDAAQNELGQIAGQRPSKRLSKKSISNFKLRQGLAIGCAVTLRGARMYEFYERLVNVAVPRIRDFRGLSPRAFDGRGNYTTGLKEQTIFPEINVEKVGKIRGLDVTIVTTAKTDEEGRELLKLMDMPFRQR